MAKVSPSSTEGAKRYVVSVPNDLKLGPGIVEALEKIDSDGDGILTLPELMSMVKDKESAEAEDAFTDGGVQTASSGETLAQPSDFFAGDANLLDLLDASAEQLDSLKELDFTTPYGEFVRMPIAFVLATPDEEGEAWDSLELFGQAGQSVFISNTNVTLLIPSTDFRAASAVDLSTEADESTPGRRLQFGGGQRTPPTGSFRMGPRPGAPPPPPRTSSPPGRGGPGTRRLSEEERGAGRAGQRNDADEEEEETGRPGLPTCGNFCPRNGRSSSSFGGQRDNEQRTGGNGAPQSGPPNRFTGQSRGPLNPSGQGMGRPRF